MQVLCAPGRFSDSSICLTCSAIGGCTRKASSEHRRRRYSAHLMYCSSDMGLSGFSACHRHPLLRSFAPSTTSLAPPEARTNMAPSRSRLLSSMLAPSITSAESLLMWILGPFTLACKHEAAAHAACARFPSSS